MVLFDCFFSNLIELYHNGNTYEQMEIHMSKKSNDYTKPKII